MKTQFNKKTAYPILASIAALMVLTGCGSSVAPISGSSDNAAGSTGNGNGSSSSSSGSSSSSSSGSVTPTATGSTTSAGVTVTTPWTNARLAEGDDHSCLLDISGGVWCWGYNNSGQLGNGTTTNGKYLARVETLTSGAVMVAAGGDHTCALDSSNGVWCWGANESGELGNGSYTGSTVPVRVSGLSSGVQALAVGFQHTCAIDATSTLWCWGSNSYGQLGNNSVSNSDVPVQVSGFSGGAVALALGYHHSCATDTNGALWCWGFNNSGRLGDGTTTNRLVPTAVSGLSSGVLAVSAGYVNTCAVDSSDALWCWGANEYGQLGTGGSAGGTLTPVMVSAVTIGIQTLSLGGYHVCVTDGGTNVQCWGYNYYGQVGTGSYSVGQPTPLTVSEVSGPVRGLALGGYHTCVLDGTGMQCWGDDYYDQLGDGTYSNSTVPVQVYKVEPPQS